MVARCFQVITRRAEASDNAKIIAAIGYDTRSELTTATMVCIAFSQFVNVGVITLLTNSVISYVPILSTLFPFVRMEQSDIGVGWYLTIGSVITNAMRSLAMQPWIQLLLSYIIWRLGRAKDFYCAGRRKNEDGSEESCVTGTQN